MSDAERRDARIVDDTAHDVRPTDESLQSVPEAFGLADHAARRRRSPRVELDAMHAPEWWRRPSRFGGS